MAPTYGHLPIQIHNLTDGEEIYGTVSIYVYSPRIAAVNYHLIFSVLAAHADPPDFCSQRLLLVHGTAGSLAPGDATVRVDGSPQFPPQLWQVTDGSWYADLRS